MKRTVIPKLTTKPVHLEIIAGILFVMVVVYLVLIQLWSMTSGEYSPSNFIDSEVKIPQDRKEWFDRRRHGV